jgi:hypothetical protein
VGREHLDHRHGRGVVTAQHEGQEAGPPPRGDLRPGGVELRPGRGALGQHAVADVRQRQVFEVALEHRRVGLDGVGGEAEVPRPGVGALPEIDAALERDAVDDDAGLAEARVTGDEAR